MDVRPARGVGGREAKYNILSLTTATPRVASAMSIDSSPPRVESQTSAAPFQDANRLSASSLWHHGQQIRFGPRFGS